MEKNRKNCCPEAEFVSRFKQQDEQLKYTYLKQLEMLEEQQDIIKRLRAGILEEIFTKESAEYPKKKETFLSWILTLDRNLTKQILELKKDALEEFNNSLPF